MNRPVAIPIVVSAAIGLSTLAYAQDVDRVRRELERKGYDQVEFTRTKLPYSVNACSGGKLLRMRVDNDGKITKKTLVGFCRDGGARPPAAASPDVAAPEQSEESEDSTISSPSSQAGKSAKDKTDENKTEDSDDSKTTDKLDCKKFFPTVGMTLTVPCE